MYLGITRVGSLSVADAEVDQVSTSGRPVDDRVDSLISRIRPARHSEQRRHRVAQYVSSLITRCFSTEHEVEAFMFGSVPLKTYLPDGDIDLSVFQSKGNPLRDIWTTKLCSVLEDEQQDPYAAFKVRDVQVIHAEVKLLKCLVDNIVVDISFETLGGLCTVAFLESIDRHIQGQHLFKRSVILVKAWCYYESRLLGAHHGLISTYALETMVLYIFNVHHRDLDTPCQVLHKFLEVFSQFDWDKYCLSLQGPIILASFPNPKVENPPEVQQDSLLLSGDFTDEMMEMYSPVRQKVSEADGKAAMPQSNRNFPVKFLNIVDPLLPTNNLGRSVSKASFARIRKALAHGAQSLSSIIAKDESDAVSAIDKFFKNTWNAQRPIAKPIQQNMVQQPGVSWQGNKQMHGYGSPVINIPPEHLQYWQQYQQQRMLQHMQQQHQQQQHQQQNQQYQQQLQNAARHQQRVDPTHASGSSPTSSQVSPMLPQYAMQLQQLQQQHQPSGHPRPVQMPSLNGHMEPPIRVDSPFAAHAQTESPDRALQPDTPDIAAQIVHSVPAAAAAAADDDDDKHDVSGPADGLNKPPDDLIAPVFHEGAAVPRSVPSTLPESMPQHHTICAPDAVLHPSEPSYQASPSSASHLPTGGPVPPVNVAEAVQDSRGTSAVPGTLAASSPALQNGLASHLQQIPSSMMLSLGYPVQGYGVPMSLQSGSNRDMYAYGGMMVPMMLPGMMLPPPPQHQQQQHHNKAGRSSRGQSSVANGTGSANGKWDVAGQQQAAVEQLFSDMRPQFLQQPVYQRQDQQQLPQQQQYAAPAQQPRDILAGDIEQLNEHLHSARVCHVQKAAVPQDTTASSAASHQGATPLPNGTPQTAHQATGQQRRADTIGPADRSRPKERHDRWPNANGPYAPGRLAQSHSPPMTPAYAQSHVPPIPPHLLQQQFPGQAFLPPASREMRHAHQQQRQAYWHPQQQHAAMPPWQAQPPRSPSVDDLHIRSTAAITSQAGSQPATPHSTHSHLPVTEPLYQISQDQLAEAAASGADAVRDELANANPALLVNHAEPSIDVSLPPVSVLHGPASVDSPPAPRGIWGDGLHQQRLTNLANDLASVKVAAPSIRPAAPAAAAAEAPATINFGAYRRADMAASSSSRSAGSTPHAGDAVYRGRGMFPFDSSTNVAVLNKRRQRFPHNASAQELGQNGGGSIAPEAAGRRDRAAKLSLDSLTSQAEAAQRQQALSGFELNTEDFPALGGLAQGPSMAASPSPVLTGSRAAHSRAWSETDALSPPVHKSPPA